MTLLTIVQYAQDLISGMPRCTAVIGNDDPQVLQLLGLAKEAGRTLVEVHPWTRLTRTQTYVTVSGEAQADFLPADFDRFVDESMWNTTRRLRVNGPLTPQEYRAMSAMVTSPSFNWFHVRRGVGYIFPAPTVGETIQYDYISRLYCASEAGVDQFTWSADTDIGSIFEHGGIADERLYSLAIVWMWLSRKGLDFSTELSAYQVALNRKIAVDGGRRGLDAAGYSNSYVQPPGTPDGTWSL